MVRSAGTRARTDEGGIRDAVHRPLARTRVSRARRTIQSISFADIMPTLAESPAAAPVDIDGLDFSPDPFWQRTTGALRSMSVLGIRQVRRLDASRSLEELEGRPRPEQKDHRTLRPVERHGRKARPARRSIRISWRSSTSSSHGRTFRIKNVAARFRRKATIPTVNRPTE